MYWCIYIHYCHHCINSKYNNSNQCCMETVCMKLLLKHDMVDWMIMWLHGRELKLYDEKLLSILHTAVASSWYIHVNPCGVCLDILIHRLHKSDVWTSVFLWTVDMMQHIADISHLLNPGSLCTNIFLTKFWSFWYTILYVVFWCGEITYPSQH